MANYLTTISLYTVLKLISPKKRKPQKEVSVICFYNDTAWDSNDACGQGWTLNKITFESCKSHTCRMGCVGVGDGPVTTTATSQERSDGSINLRSGCIDTMTDTM